MENHQKVGIICCSDGRNMYEKPELAQLAEKLSDMGMNVVFAEHLYRDGENIFSAPASVRAKELMDFYRDESIHAIFDISGGNIANEILPYLDYNIIARSNKLFWGYSDLTTVINAVYTKTGKPSVLYQVRNILKENIALGKELFSFDYQMLNGGSMQGIVVGGNIRCLLKLAGTPYFPDMHGKILLLEARSGNIGAITAYLNQLKQMGVFDKINGMILGTFTELEKSGFSVEQSVLAITERKIPVAKTFQIGHNSDSKAIVIGSEIALK